MRSLIIHVRDNCTAWVEGERGEEDINRNMTEKMFIDSHFN